LNHEVDWGGERNVRIVFGKDTGRRMYDRVPLIKLPMILGETQEEHGRNLIG